MNVVKVLHPREYESLIKMIKQKSRYHKIPAFLFMSSDIYADVVVVFVRPDESFIVV